jgi:hypothetical protein
MMQLPSPLPNPSPQIHQQLLDYPPLPPHSTCCIGIGSKGSAHQAAHTSIDMAVVGPGQERAYMCTSPCFHLLHIPLLHSSMHCHSFIASFLHPLPILPHLCMPVHCCLCSHPLIQVCTFVCACAAIVCLCMLIRCCCIVIVSIKHQITILLTFCLYTALVMPKNNKIISLQNI